MARLLAEAGETVHVLTERWDGAPERELVECDGRLVVHRVGLDEALGGDAAVPEGLLWSTCPSQVFSWQAALYAEALIEREQIDVVEGQEWEAPLYYLQLRRALGLGPKREPPCLVHLHSPTEMIFEHNEWDRTLTDFEPLSRLEEYTIRAADGLVCPSEYLARGVAERFTLEAGRIRVVRYPMGETAVLERGMEAWRRNAICYVGRLELRKGVVEWVDAAVMAAQQDATVSFDFYGSDTSIDGGVGRSVLSVLRGKIPKGLRERFRFHGGVGREQLMEALGQMSLGVVPSRWENLPFTCIEMMATGLPVIVSPHGGMAELIEDGVSGWVAEDGSAEKLAKTLLQASQSGAEERRAMGLRAAERVRAVCANERVVREQIALRAELAKVGASRSKWFGGVEGRLEQVPDGYIGHPGTCRDEIQGSFPSLRMTRISAGVEVVNVKDAESRCLAVERLLLREPELLAVAFLDATVRVEAGFVEKCEAALRRQDQVGIVRPWVWSDGKRRNLDAAPFAISLEGESGDLPVGSVVRVAALVGESGLVNPVQWETLRDGGWLATRYPEALLVQTGTAVQEKRRYSGMALIQNRTPEFALEWFLATPLREKVRWIGRMVGQPRRVWRWVVWQMRSRVGRKT
jgi:glycosyltransferase involved in cell wall biosynthesis